MTGIQTQTKRFLSIFIFAALVLAGLPLAAGKSSPSTEIDAFLKSQLAADQPGAAVIVVKDGKVLFRKAYGMADLELGVPLQPDMVFRLGSITKQFTAVSILMLEEQGKLSLQDPITKFLPDYPTQGHLITVEHLLTHTSGIKSYTNVPEWMANKATVDMSLQELIDGFKKEPMEFAPGEKYAYNNSGYVLLGAVIEKASGEKYEKFIKDHIFVPLGMKDSHYGSNAPIIPKRASGYTGRPGQVANARYLSMTLPHAAGSLVSNVDDLAAWDAALYTEKLLKKSSLEKMWTPYKLKDGTSTGYGYGWAIGELRGRPTQEHGGGIFGFSTYGLRLADDRVYVAVLCNSDNPQATPAFLAKKLAAIAVGDPFPARTTIELDAKLLERYTGVYKIDETVKRTVTVRAGKLYTQRTGGAQLEAKPYSETEFFYENSLTHFRFVVDSEGKVTEMLMYQDGRETPERAVKVSDVPVEKKEKEFEPDLYDNYVGEYELMPEFIITVTREGDRLMVQATGQPKFEIFPESETKFFLKVVDAQITFVKGPSGRADELILHQEGREMRAKRRK